jgi:hypothetical protein
MTKKNIKYPPMKAHEAAARDRRLTCLLSKEEQRVVEQYLSKYKISNKSRWLRETVLSVIRQHLEEDYPTLFCEHDMRR